MKHRSGRVMACGLLLFSLLACKMLKGKAEAGKECSEDGARACHGTAEQLVCQGGLWRAFPCSGTKGCTASPTVSCDISGNSDGDACAAADDKSQVCGDAQRVTCNAGKIQVTACKGKNGCKESGGKATCDTTISEVGTDCPKDREKAYACSLDEKTRLRCQNGRWTTEGSCRGKKGCFVGKDGGVYCDASLAYVGDTCWHDGDSTCSPNGKTELRCKNGKWAYQRTCYSSKGCRTEPGDKEGSWKQFCN